MKESEMNFGNTSQNKLKNMFGKMFCKRSCSRRELNPWFTCSFCFLWTWAWVTCEILTGEYSQRKLLFSGSRLIRILKIYPRNAPHGSPQQFRQSFLLAFLQKLLLDFLTVAVTSLWTDKLSRGPSFNFSWRVIRIPIGVFQDSFHNSFRESFRIFGRNSFKNFYRKYA